MNVSLSFLQKKLPILAVIPIVSFSLLGTGSVAALSSTSNSSSSTSSTTLTTAQQTDLNNLKTKGTAEINRRLKSLSSALSQLSSSTKLSSSDQTYLTSEVNTEISGLTALKTQLNSETTLTAARSDVQSIFSDYRVYALILPKMRLIETADNQLTLESKLTSLAQTLQTDLTTDLNAGKNVTALQTTLNDLTTKTTNAQTISNSIQSSVLTLQPTNYDSDHTILSGDLAQLKTAHSDIVAADNDGKNIVSGLKTL